MMWSFGNEVANPIYMVKPWAYPSIATIVSFDNSPQILPIQTSDYFKVGAKCL